MGSKNNPLVINWHPCIRGQSHVWKKSSDDRDSLCLKCFKPKLIPRLSTPNTFRKEIVNDQD